MPRDRASPLPTRAVQGVHRLAVDVELQLIQHRSQRAQAPIPDILRSDPSSPREGRTIRRSGT